MNYSRLVSLLVYLLAGVSRCCAAVPITVPPSAFTDSLGRSITIRQTSKADLPGIQAMSVAAFARAYNFSTQKQLDDCTAITATLLGEELKHLQAVPSTTLSLVAECGGKIVGNLSVCTTDNPGEIYGKSLSIDPAFQKQGLAKQLLLRCYNLLPGTHRVVCVTRHVNLLAQKLYEHFGGKRVENAPWRKHLYTCLDKLSYVGYEFDTNAIAAIKKQSLHKST